MAGDGGKRHEVEADEIRKADKGKFVYGLAADWIL
jgi:hypothetical protein